jgi:uncharacterized protein YodC (DUF2158 family)
MNWKLLLPNGVIFNDTDVLISDGSVQFTSLTSAAILAKGAGCRVRLKSGSPLMTVMGVSNSVASCGFFNEKQEFNIYRFSIDSLIPDDLDLTEFKEALDKSQKK